MTMTKLDTVIHEMNTQDTIARARNNSSVIVSFDMLQRWMKELRDANLEHVSIKVLASALNKLAPEEMKLIISRFDKYKTEEDKYLEELLKVLRATPSA